MTALALKLNDLRLPDALRRHWRAWAVLGAMAALWLVAAISVGVQSVAPRPSSTGSRRPRPSSPGIRAEADRHLGDRAAAGQSAHRARAQRGDPDRAAGQSGGAPFHLAGSAADQARSLDCLTAAIYYEAATEPTDGQRGGRPGRAEPRPPPRLSHFGLRRRLRRRAPRHRLPVQLHLRRLAAPGADRDPIGSGRGRSRRRRSTAMSMRRSAGRPIITPIM